MKTKIKLTTLILIFKFPELSNSKIKNIKLKTINKSQIFRRMK